MEFNAMQEKINSIMVRLNDSGENYPHLTKLWKRYIKMKIDFLNNSLYEAELFLNKIENESLNDMEPKTCALLYLINQHINFEK